LVKQDANTVLVVTHAGVIRVLMAIVQKLSLEDAFYIDVPYASATVFDTDLQTFSTIK
jgi:broad specificity phosphatase PhoE